MNPNKMKEENKEIEIPIFIRGTLIFIASALCFPMLSQGFSAENLIYFAFILVRNILLLPGLFVIVGILLRLSDNTFKLSNAYYLGVLMAIVLSVQEIKST